jgi:hypothetical protein
MKTSIRYALLALIAGAFISGCSTMNVTEFKAQPASTYRYKAETNGLTLAVEPFTAKHQVKETFNTDVVSKGIIPVLVVVENNGSATYLLAKEKALVGKGSTNALTGQLSTGGTGDTAAKVGAGFLAVSIISGPAVVVAAPLLIGGMKAMSNADVIRHNLSDKALASHTIEPGKRAYGFLYFQLAKGQKFTGTHQVVVELTSAAGGEPLSFLFNVQ